MNRTLRKAIITTSKLKRRYNLDRTTVTLKTIRNNVTFVSVFYVKVKNNTLTTLTLKM